MTDPARAQGVHGTGSPKWSLGQFRVVVRFLLDAPGQHSIAEISEATGVPGRTIRAIVGRADGVHFAAEINNRGVGVALTADAIERGNRRLRRQIRRMEARIAGRERFRDLPRLQGELPIDPGP